MSTEITSVDVVNSTVNNTPIGNSLQSSGSFTTIQGTLQSSNVNGCIINGSTLNNCSSYSESLNSPAIIGGHASSFSIISGSVDSTPIGVSTAAAGVFTNVDVLQTLTAHQALNVQGAASLNGGATSVTPGAGDSSTKVATTAWFNIGFSYSLGASGYIKFPSWAGGFTLQWVQGAQQSDTSSGSNPTQTINWPTSFNTACLMAFACALVSSISDDTHGPMECVVAYNAAIVVTQRYRLADHGSDPSAPLVFGIGH